MHIEELVTKIQPLSKEIISVMRESSVLRINSW